MATQLKPNCSGDTGYVAAFKDLANTFAAQQLPVQAIQLDSWWYSKASDSGLYLWEPVKCVFPDWWHLPDYDLVLHNRFFSSTSPYVTSGNYTFVTDGTTAVPLDSRLFADIMLKAKTLFNMVTYEQDWLVVSNK